MSAKIATTVKIAPTASVTGGELYHEVIARDNVRITGGELYNNATIRDHATVTGGLVADNATVGGNATVTGGSVRGLSIVGGNAVISAGMYVHDMLVMNQEHISAFKAGEFSVTIAPSVNDTQEVLITWGCKIFSVESLSLIAESDCETDWKGTFEEHKGKVLSEAKRIEKLLNE